MVNTATCKRKISINCLVSIFTLVYISLFYLNINRMNPCTYLSERNEILEDKVTELEENNSRLEGELVDKLNELEIERSGIGIVQKAYQQTFGLITCDRTISEWECHKRLRGIDGLPWWFRNMLRDVSELNRSWSNKCVQGASMCAIEKIGYSQWHKIFCYTNEIQNTRQHEKICDIALLPDEQCHKQPKFVFTRDPLERFLSAYIDKCEVHLHKQHHCAPLLIFEHPQMLQNMTKQMRFETYVDTMPLSWNMHFFPQSTYCNGIRRRLDDYDFVGEMGVNFYRDVEEVSKRFPAIANATENVFRLKAHAGKQNMGTETKSSTRVQAYYTPNTVRKVLQYYAVDYVELGLTIPQWAIDMLA